MSYGLKTNYAPGVAVSPGDLNRRADVLQAQLPGAFQALGAGVFEPAALLVNSPTGKVAPGSALIENHDGVLVYVSVPNALSIPARAGETYLHLALRVPSPIGGPEDTAGTDSLRGAIPRLQLSDDEEETDALLLARWDSGAWVDARPFSLPAQFQQVVADLGYSEADRAKGTVATRLNTLFGTGGDDEESEEVSLRAEVSALKASVADLQALVATLSEKIGLPGTISTVEDLDRYLHRDVARLEVESVLQNPSFSLEIDASVAIPGIAGNGDDLGSGLTARDVHSGNTTWDEVEGEER